MFSSNKELFDPDEEFHKGIKNLLFHHLFQYDFSIVKSVIQILHKAMKLDFQEMVRKGEYGTYYKTLMGNINELLVNKEIVLEFDETGEIKHFHFLLKDSNVKLSLRDLSHGELRRLSIFIWIKYAEIQNSIVFMDEPEIAFHPDWQIPNCRRPNQMGTQKSVHFSYSFL